jgi:putative membrane protein
MTYLALAVGHHLLVFSLLGVLVAERALMVGRLAPEDVRRLGSLDAAYGALAAGIVVVGSLRVYFGGKGADFYLSNPLFWAKIGAFALVALLSIAPTIRILAWRRALKSDHAFSPAPDQVVGVRHFLSAELMVFPLIPIFAAAMAMGYGLDGMR